MGGNASTRRVTVLNDDPTSVIKVSDSVVRRLKGELEDTPPSCKTPVVGSGIAVATVPSPILDPNRGSTSLKLRQERETELQRLEAYWQKRLEELDEEHTKINSLTGEAFDQAVRDVKRNFKRGIRPPSCLDAREKMLECYKTNPKEPLKCAKEVSAFTSCVDSRKLQHVITTSE